MSITFFKVWKRSKPYIVTETSAEGLLDLGFALKEKDGSVQYFKKFPKTNKIRKDLFQEISKVNGKTKVQLLSKISKDDAQRFKTMGWESYLGYKFDIKKCKEATKVAKEIIRKHFKHLISARMTCYIKRGKVPVDEASGLIKLAFVTVNRNLIEKFSNYDFIIFIYEDVWEALNKDEVPRLIEHELCHVKCSKGEFVCVDHDYSDFRSIIAKYGIDWAEEIGKRVRLIVDENVN